MAAAAVTALGCAAAAAAAVVVGAARSWSGRPHGQGDGGAGSGESESKRARLEPEPEPERDAGETAATATPRTAPTSPARRSSKQEPEPHATPNASRTATIGVAPKQAACNCSLCADVPLTETPREEQRRLKRSRALVRRELDKGKHDANVVAALQLEHVLLTAELSSKRLRLGLLNDVDDDDDDACSLST